MKAIRVDVFPNAAALAQASAEDVVVSAHRAVDANGDFFWCLAGGHTPRLTYELLASRWFAGRMPWNRTHVFFGDERCVPPSDDEPDRWVSARRRAADGLWRVTLTPRVLSAARRVRFLVVGAHKAARLADVLTPPARPDELPVHRIRAAGELRWLVDRAAARFLGSGGGGAREFPGIAIGVRG